MFKIKIKQIFLKHIRNILLVLSVFSVTDCFGESEGSWKIGGKIHFEEQSGFDYIGTVAINGVTREVVKEFFDIISDSCADNAKVLIKRENGHFVIRHYEEKSKPGIGEEMHATLLYTSKRTEDGHETLKDICNNLGQVDKTISCEKAPPLEQVSTIYQKIIKPQWRFEISDVVFWASPISNVIVVKLLFNGRDEIVNKEGNPVTGGALHMTLLNIDSLVASETGKINRIISKLKEKLSGKMLKVGDRNGQADLEFGISGSTNRLRPPSKD